MKFLNKQLMSYKLFEKIIQLKFQLFNFSEYFSIFHRFLFELFGFIFTYVSPNEVIQYDTDTTIWHYNNTHYDPPINHA